MYRQLLFATAMFIGFAETASAGHRHFYSAYGVPMVYSAPIVPAFPVAAYQPAYIVPPTPFAVASYPNGPVVYGSPGFAPMVPMTYGYGRPRDLDVRLRFRRDGGYRYRVNFD